MEELDLSVFKSDFDPHARGKQCMREINGVRENKHPNTTHKLSSFNQQKLLEYAGWMIHKIKRDEFSVSSFEKNLSESWKLCLFLGEKRVPDITEKDLKSWWGQELTRYEQKKIKHGSLRKEYECAQTFLKWLVGLNGSQRHPLMQTLDMPRPPRAKLIERMPSQSEIKTLIEAANTGQKFSIRDQAIISLANDTGARISEILSMRNKHIRPEKNYLVVSFPESKTAPRTVISFLAKPFLEQWVRLSPNKDKGSEAFVFCQADGSPISYAGVKKSLDRALQKTKIPWVKGKSMHYFRSLFSSRAFNWSYAVKHYWLGWSFQDHEKSYTRLDYTQCTKSYFEMLQAEQNPMIGKEAVFWEKEIDQDAEFRKTMLDLLVEEIGADKIGKALANIKKKVEQQGTRL